MRCERCVHANAYCAAKRMTYASAAYGYHFFSSRHLVCHVECALPNHFEPGKKKKQYGKQCITSAVVSTSAHTQRAEAFHYCFDVDYGSTVSVPGGCVRFRVSLLVGQLPNRFSQPHARRVCFRVKCKGLGTQRRIVF